MTTPPTEPKRIRALRLAIVKQLPKFPNNKATKETLERKSLGSLFIDYINWACRYVPPRPRKVALEPTVTSDSRWRTLRNAIDIFLNKVRNGENLTPHLSLLVHKQGFSPATAAKAPDVNRWADKDFLLNVMGFHHFHLGIVIEAAGHVARTDDVLFAAVTRDEFAALAIFDHSAFERTDTITQTMTAERNRLWDIFTKRSSRGIPPGAVYVPAMITTSGHSYHHVRLADQYARIVRELDPKIDDPSFIKSLYEDAKITIPLRPKLKWNLHYLDLGLLDESQNIFFILHMGPT